MQITALDIARNFLGIQEVEGAMSNPLIVGMAQIDAKWVTDDQTAWCSAFVNFVCFVLGLPRSKSLAARSWLLVGQSVPLVDARPGFDVVVLTRGAGKQPGATVIKAPGHVGFYIGQDASSVEILGGNQRNAVTIASFPKAKVLRVSRIREE